MHDLLRNVLDKVDSVLGDWSMSSLVDTLSDYIYINFYHETNAIEGSALEHKHLVPKKGKAFRDTATLSDF